MSRITLTRTSWTAEVLFAAFVSIGSAGFSQYMSSFAGALAQSEPAYKVLAEGTKSSDVPSKSDNLVMERPMKKLVGLDCKLLKRESPAEKDGIRRYDYSLKLKNPSTTIELEELEQNLPGPTSESGFYEDSLLLDWVQRGRILHVCWSTLPVGSGGYLMATDLLIVKGADAWDVVFRIRHQYYYQLGAGQPWNLIYEFVEDAKKSSLVMKESEGKSEWAPKGDLPLYHSIGEGGFMRRVWVQTIWPCRISEKKLVFEMGERRLGFEGGPFPIEDVVRYVKENRKEPCDAAKLRLLNRKLRKTDVCSEDIVIEDFVPPFVSSKYSREFDG